MYGWGSTIIVFDRSKEATPSDVEIPILREEIHLTGEWDFSIEGSSERKRVTLQSWTEFGFPHYSGSGVYSKTFDLPSDCTFDQLILELGDVRDTAEVWLNGTLIGIRAWRPYRFDITKVVHEAEGCERSEAISTERSEAIHKVIAERSEQAKPNDNQLKIIVTNTLENEFNQNPIPSGLLGDVRLEVF